MKAKTKETTPATCTKAKAPANAAIKSKLISKPQTVDVSGMKVESVTLTDKAKLVIRYKAQ